jgi:uncharacterized protein YceK
MKKLLFILAFVLLVSGCGSAKVRKYSPGAVYSDARYRLIILSYSDRTNALGAAVLDIEGDDIIYSPHPEEMHVQTFDSMSFADASYKARRILGRHCGIFSFSSILLATPDNITTGYEILPIIKETPFCRVGKPVSLNFSGPVNGTVVINLPKRNTVPFNPDVRIFR